MSQWKCVYRAAHAIEANLLKGLLASHGIASRVDGEALVGAYSGVPRAADARLMVATENSAEARRVLEDFEQQGNDAPAWQCGHCEETNAATFDTCWQCGNAQPTPEPE